MSMFKGFSIQFFVCIWFGLFSTVSNAVEAKIAKRLKYESQPTHYMEKHIPRDTFIQKRRASGSQMHEVVIAVHQLNIPKLQEIVIQRATPGHPQYQQWLSFEEVGTMVRNEEGYGKVMEWLEAYEVDVKWSSPYGEYIRAEGRISQWEKMLSTEFYEFEDLSHKKGESDKGKMFYRALEYWIPSELEGSITAIFNTVQTPPEYKARYGSRILKEKASSIYPYEDTPYKTHLRADSLLSKDSHSPKIHTAQTGDDVTVDFLNKLYKISRNIASPLLNQSVFQTGNQYFSPQDLTSFQNYYSLTKQPAMSIGNRAVDTCPQTSAASCDEGNLDLQYIMGVAQKTGTIFWYVSQNNGDPFLAWITDVSAEQYPPQSNSISWGSVETFVSPATVLLWEIEAMKLAGRGVTISVSSGDDGAPNSSSSGTCYCSSARPSAKGYNPYYPATSRWVTTIGATMGPETGGAEVVCDSKQGGVITSGGGFSTIVSRPSYQNSTVSLYFQRVASSPPVSGFTVAGRAYPDLSFIGVNYQVIIAGYFYSVFGTSASAPVFAAFVTLLNSARLAANKTAIGFINPTLYEVGYNISTTTRNIYNATFNDVTSGNNKCCKSSVAANAVCCDTGFTAIEGWDPVTGWGSINYPDFAKIFEVAAPYTPSESKKDDSKTIGGVPVLIIGIVIIVIVLLVLFSLLTFCCCTKSSVVNAAPRNAAVYPTTAQAAPPVTQVQVQYVNYQPHLPQPAQQKYAPSF